MNVNPVTGEILDGPFGFRADDLGKTVPSSAGSSDYLDYLDYSLTGYSDGALKTNFNPINGLWEYNYLPSQEGGYFSSEVHEDVASHMLAPKDPSNFSDRGRWSCYVRFDHSQTLDLSRVGADNLSQEKITVNGFVPDRMDELDNIAPINPSLISQASLQGYTQDAGRPHSVFVKCSVDSKLYMTPKVVDRKVKVHARGAAAVPNYGAVYNSGPHTDYSPEDILIPVNALQNGLAGGPVDTSENHTVQLSSFDRYYDANSQSHIIDTSTSGLDDEHVYAVVTLPGQVVPIQSYRFTDAVATASAGLDYVTNSIYGRGVVFGLDGFDLPPPKQDYIPEEDALRQKALKKLSVPDMSVNFSAPSPVYPDLVVIPLTSTERCYGPWLSSTFDTNGVITARTRYPDIGGRIEFSKDEQLAPWNFDGYDLMNEAGFIRAEFSNSLLLFAEKGSFTIPGLPLNMSLGQALVQGGPLVTSINVNVDSNVKTSVQMEMFSASFGKMQEQREESIAKLARDREKVKDIYNRLTEGSLKRNASAYTGDNKTIEALHRRGLYSSLQTGNTVYDVMVSTVTREEEERLRAGATVSGVVSTDYYKSVALQSRGYLDEAMTVNSDPNENRALIKKSAGAHLSHIFSPYDELPYNGNMPSVPYVHTQAIQERTS